jgi:hypothetical protein
MILFNRVFKKVNVKNEVTSMKESLKKMDFHISSMQQNINEMIELNKEKSKLTYEMLDLLNGLDEHFDKKIKRDEVV